MLECQPPVDETLIVVNSVSKLSHYTGNKGAVITTSTFVFSLIGIGSVYKRHPVTKFEHGNHGASKRKFNHMTIY